MGWEEWLKDPILSGPYTKLKDVTWREERVPGPRRLVEAASRPISRSRLHLNVPEAATRLAMLASQQADVVTLSALYAEPGLWGWTTSTSCSSPLPSTCSSTSTTCCTRTIRATTPTTHSMDPRVREAFTIAIDRQALVDTIYAGKSEVQNAPMMATGMRGWDHPLVVEMRNNPIPFDPGEGEAVARRGELPHGQRRLRILAGVWAPSGAPEKKEVTEAVRHHVARQSGPRTLSWSSRAQPVSITSLQRYVTRTSPP